MDFSTAMKNEAHKTYTENGAMAFNTTGNALLDFFSTAGSLRGAESNRIVRLFSDAYNQDKLLATKALFYARDIREGLGERSTFREILKYAATNMPEAIIDNIPLIGLYGRYDDLYALVGTPLEDKMWEYVSKQLEFDEANMLNQNHNVSLLAKWLKTADASSEATRKLGIYTAKKLGMSVYVYKRKIRALRKYINVVETKMSSNNWDQIDYATVPARAMLLYYNAFAKHDNKRLAEYLVNVSKGTEKINTGTLYPYDIVEKYFDDKVYNGIVEHTDPVIEEMWKALPNYVDAGTNAIVMADTSGSMYGRPLHSALALAIYFAEHNTGAYHNMWMSFSRTPTIHMIKGNTLHEKLQRFDMSDWCMNTNLEAAMLCVLNVAIENNVPDEEMVKSIIIISDMEIDAACGSEYNKPFYDSMKDIYAEHGYSMPNIVFWNVESRHDVFHADANQKGVQLCSGHSASTFKNVIASIGMTPVQMMLNTLNSNRYMPVTIAD